MEERGIMGDPEFRSGEKILLRTQGIFVKSIPFEGILTNKRIFLVDRAKNLLPPKEILLDTIKKVESGENAIRDQTITLSIEAKAGETRQMILTFSRQTGGNRVRERDEWKQVIAENMRSSFEQVLRKVIPGADQTQKQPQPLASPRIEVVNTAAPAGAGPAGRATPKKEIESVHPIKRIIETGPAAAPATAPSPVQYPPSPPVQEPVARPDVTHVFCTRCGNRVSSDSAFCNRCGTPIVVPAGMKPAPTPFPAGSPPTGTQRARPADETSPPERLQQIPAWDEGPEKEPASPQNAMTRDQPATGRQPSRKPPKQGLFSRLFSRKKRVPIPPKPAAGTATVLPPAPKKRGRGSGVRPGKKMVIAVIAVLIVIVLVGAGAVFLLPMLTSGGPGAAEGSSGTTVTAVATTNPVQATPTIVVAATTPQAVPSTGVQVHVSYIGGYKGTYGMPSDLQTVQSSGDRYFEIVNATGSIQASFQKLDSSTTHALTVEIYKNGKLLTQGSVSTSYGTVTLSADATTGVAKPAQTSGGTLVTTTTGTVKSGNVSAGITRAVTMATMTQTTTKTS